MQFLKFASNEDEQLCATIRQQNVLLIDDVATSVSTINEILRTLRILNEDNDITIFSLIGRKDLMAARRKARRTYCRGWNTTLCSHRCRGFVSRPYRRCRRSAHA